MKMFMVALLIALLPGLCGCGDDRPPLLNVSGRVLLNGEGVTAGAINFHPEATNVWAKDNPSSQLQLDGSFQMKTFPYGDGVPLGKYKVTLTPELAARIKHPELGFADKTPWEIDIVGEEIRDHVFEVE